MEGSEEGVGTADLGIGGGMADLRLKTFSGSASFASLLPRDGDGDTVDASVSIFFTRPPDALISFNKALNPAGRVGGGTEAEEEEAEGGGGGGTDLRWSFSPSSFCFFSSSVWLFSPFTRPPDALISFNSALNPAGRLGGIDDDEEEEEEAEEGGLGMADLGIGGGPPGFRRSFDSFDSFDSSSLLVPSTLNSFTRPPDALISLSKALNPAGRLGGIEEEEEEEVEEGGGGGGTDLRLSFSPLSSSSSFFFFSSSVWLLVPSTLNSFTRPPDALISFKSALNPAGRLGGIEAEAAEATEEAEEAEGIADTGTGGGMDVPRTESLTDEDGSGGGCFETAGEGTTGAMEGTTRLDSIEVLLHSLAEGWTR